MSRIEPYLRPLGRTFGREAIEQLTFAEVFHLVDAGCFDENPSPEEVIAKLCRVMPEKFAVEYREFDVERRVHEAQLDAFEATFRKYREVFRALAQ